MYVWMPQRVHVVSIWMRWWCNARKVGRLSTTAVDWKHVSGAERTPRHVVPAETTCGHSGVESTQFDWFNKSSLDLIGTSMPQLVLHFLSDSSKALGGGWACSLIWFVFRNELHVESIYQTELAPAFKETWWNYCCLIITALKTSSWLSDL